MRKSEEGALAVLFGSTRTYAGVDLNYEETLLPSFSMEEKELCFFLPFPKFMFSFELSSSQ